MKKSVYYALSFTWGLLGTVIGIVIALPLLVLGRYRRRHCGQFVFQVGKSWGAFSIGLTMVCCKYGVEGADGYDMILSHEFGHSVQNALMGPFFIFLVAIPSVFRYWYREVLYLFELPCHVDYYAIWFEHEATFLGKHMLETWYKVEGDGKVRK